ncbi:MAG: DHH family phosphoesterase [Patescibacteria group bacterium]
MNIKDTAPVIWKEIEKAERILLHLHPSPDPDSVGSALGMYHALRGLGKSVTVIGGDSPLPTFLSHLPGFEAIEPKNWSEIKLADFALFLILDAASLGMISHLGPVVFPLTLRTIVIDHHITNQEFAEVNLVAPEYPATAQILYELFSIWGVKLTHDIALCLFVGLWGDTLSFKIPATLPGTFAAAADLVKHAPDFAAAVFTIENNRTPEEFAFQALALNSLTVLPGGRVAYVAISNDALLSKGIKTSHLEGGGISNFIKSVRGWEIGACFIEIAPGQVKASFRTRDVTKFDLSRLATALGGGGHPAAAGVAFNSTLPQALDRFRKALCDLYPDLC